MNGRIHDKPTAEGRLAAVVIAILKGRTNENWWCLDYRDFEIALQPFIERETIHARLHELEGEMAVGDGRRVARIGQLIRQLAEVELKIIGVGY